jgi:cytochrome b
VSNVEPNIESLRLVRVWDLPVRLTHWLFVACIAFSWWTAEQRYLTWHRYSGYTLLGLLLFRIYWGFVGSSTARFAQFFYGPRAVIAHLRRAPGTSPQAPGHTPLGSWSVLTMLSLMLTQVTLGLFTTDVDGLESGPLSHWVSFDTSRLCAEIHELVFDALLWFIGLHVAAICFYFFYRRDNLLSAMWSGRKRTNSELPALSDAPAWRIWPGIALACLIVWIIVRD